MTEPWALTWRFLLGDGPFDSQLSSFLLKFLRSDPASFPDHSRDRTDRSDGGRDTWPSAAYGGHPMCGNVSDVAEVPDVREVEKRAES